VAPARLPSLAGDDGADWPNVTYPPSTIRPSAITRRRSRRKQVSSLDEVDPEIRSTFEKLGIPLEEQKLLAGVAGRRGVSIRCR